MKEIVPPLGRTYPVIGPACEIGASHLNLPSIPLILSRGGISQHAASSGDKMESIPDGDLGLSFEKSGRLTE